MQTILYQGKPAEGGAWLAIPDTCVETYKKLGYEVRELVLRSEAETAKVEHFNAAIAQAATIAAERGAHDLAERIRGLRMRKTARAA